MDFAEHDLYLSVHLTFKTVCQNRTDIDSRNVGQNRYKGDTASYFPDLL
jgi:hypothetical protein